MHQMELVVDLKVCFGLASILQESNCIFDHADFIIDFQDDSLNHLMLIAGSFFEFSARFSITIRNGPNYFLS